ncbi:MAG TPA: universal stress protein [Methylomirabilota bacterium]|nr:universal stress protein [Methylomirabilota bacterium]
MRVLLATDGSKDARAAAAFLKDLALPPSTAVRIVAVVTVPDLALDVSPAREFKRAVRDQAQAFIDAAQATLASKGFAVESEIAVGDPRQQIVGVAEQWGADLIVVGARGLGLVKRFLLGSVSLAVARHAHCPVLVVKGRPRKLASVLVGMDGSEDSFRAVRFLQSLCLRRPTKVRLLSVVERLHYPSSAPGALKGQLAAMIKEVEAERRAELEKVLERAATHLNDKITRVTKSTPTGNPADEIIATADAFDADLVVVGARGLGGMARLLLGSVSEKVLRHARCPVLIVKQQPKA